MQERRIELCARLQAQRQVIAQQLGTVPGTASGFPRSKTMRLLTQRPATVVRILGSLAGLLRMR